MHKFERITPDRQWVEGYFQNWVQKNITHELLEFPIDEYLNPYYTSGLMIKHWSTEDFSGKYFQGMAYAYQYAVHYTKQEGEPSNTAPAPKPDGSNCRSADALPSGARQQYHLKNVPGARRF